MPRLRMLGRAMDLLMRFKITADRLENILFSSTSYLPDDGDRKLPSQGPGRIELQNISFQYPDASPALRAVSTVIEAGTTVALVGATGSGKTTLAMLLTRFYDPSEGLILLDGADIREFSIKQVRNQFSLVFQDTFLFSSSIFDNIAYGSPDASPEEIIHAATLAQAHEFIMATPEGYSTVVGERGVTLSGGQRQRISIARAILRRPRFLVLDACTASVDNLTEKAIQEGLHALRETSTIIIIAQRFSSVESADRVCVFESGKLVEDGTPASLNKQGTAFSRILDAPAGGSS
jgi:ATP-binding cassette subfamily B protein